MLGGHLVLLIYSGPFTLSFGRKLLLLNQRDKGYVLHHTARLSLNRCEISRDG